MDYFGFTTLNWKLHYERNYWFDKVEDVKMREQRNGGDERWRSLTRIKSEELEYFTWNFFKILISWRKSSEAVRVGVRVRNIGGSLGLKQCYLVLSLKVPLFCFNWLNTVFAGGCGAIRQDSTTDSQSSGTHSCCWTSESVWRRY